MIDLTSTDIKASFHSGTAQPITGLYGLEISKGKHKPRMNLMDGLDRGSIAIHSSFSTNPIKLKLIERLYMVVIKIKDVDGNIGFVKVNANSLKKRLGLNENEFKKIKKGAVDLVLEKINQIVTHHKLYNVKNGPGIALGSRGACYVGELKDGKKEGLGFYRLSDGSLYEGEFKDDKMHGQGVLSYPNGSKYVGEFKEGKKHGHGVFTSLDGAVYDGEFIEDKKEGHGIYKFPGGSTFEGEHRNNHIFGHGTYTLPNGKQIEGDMIIH